MDYQSTESQQAQAGVMPIQMDDYRAYRVSIEVVIDTGEELLMVSPFGGAFTANFWNVPTGEVGLDELPDNAALRIAREATNLLVELTEPNILGTRVVKTERNGRIYRRLVYTYAVGVRRDAKGEMLERFCLSRDYVGHIWLKHSEKEIVGHKFDSLDSAVRGMIVRYQGIC